MRTLASRESANAEHRTVTYRIPRWILRTIREAAWLPVAVLLSFAFAASAFRLYVLYPWLDMPTHFAGGIAVTHFFRVAVVNAQDAVGRIRPVVRSLLSLGLTMLAAVAWEILEYSLDAALGTTMNRGVADTLSDLLFGLLGGLCVVLYAWYASRRPTRGSL